METFDVNILGCGSATPSLRHLPSCQMVNHRERLLMIDCGEGAQLAMRRMGLKYNRLTDIFISHTHGDHMLGLPGLLSTMSLHNVGGDITIHISADGRSVLEPLIDYFCRESTVKIAFNVISPHSGIIYEDRGITVETIPLHHRIECTGFLMREKERPRTFRPEMREFYNIPVRAIPDIKAGADFVTDDGRVIPCDHITLPPRKALSYAYCSDTMPDKAVARAVEGVDLLYHEATYDSSLEGSARERGHSTAAQAATIAREAGAGCLLIGHYSKRYLDMDLLLAEAQAIFPHTIAADEGMVIPVGDPDNFTTKWKTLRNKR